MQSKNLSSNKVYILKKSYIYYILLAFFIGVLAMKLGVRDRTIFLWPHASNFGITGISLLLALRIPLTKNGYTNKLLKTEAIIGIIINIVVETVLDIGDIPLPGGITYTHFNTADPLDMLAGIMAVVLVVAIVKLNSKHLSDR